MKRLLLSVIILSSLSLFSQNKLSLNDSLVGFDESEILSFAESKHLLPIETEYLLKISKRDFISKKYNIKPAIQVNHEDNSAKVTQAYCLNEDFENSSPTTPWLVPSGNSITTAAGIVGWTGDKATMPSNMTASCLLNIPSFSWSTPDDIMVIAPGPSGLTDAVIGGAYQIYSVFGNTPNNGNSVNSFTCAGDFFAKVNNQAYGSKVRRITKTINVTPSNSLFQFAYMAIVQACHCCCDNGGVSIRFKDCLNNLLPTPQFSVTPPQLLVITGCSTGPGPCISAGNPIALSTSTLAGWYYSKWTISAVDLSPYIGNCVKVELFGYGCPYGGHGGYAYFDAQCDTMHVINNNTSKISANTSSVTIPGCASITNTISAPIGFDPYLWQGPAGFTTSTLQTISTNIPGTYTLSMGAFGPYAGSTKYITLTHGPIPITTSSSNSILCVGDSAQLTASGVGSYTWSTGATTPNIYVTPSVTTTYTVDVNYQGCPGTAMITQSVAVCTGLNNSLRNPGSVSVFPNPNKGEFNLKINVEVKNAEFELRNVLGQVVYKQNVKQGVNSLKTDNLPKGIYNYSVLQNKEVISIGKIVIE